MLNKNVRYHHKMKSNHDTVNQCRFEQETNNLKKLLREQVLKGNLSEPYEDKTIGSSDIVYGIKKAEGQSAVHNWITNSKFKGIVGIFGY